MYGRKEPNLPFIQPRTLAFARSAALSRLAAVNLGFFEVDAAHRRLRTFAKDGCCWHETTEYAVVGQRPVAVERTIADARNAYDDGVVIVTHERLVQGHWVRTRRRVPLEE